MTSEQFAYWLNGFAELNPTMEQPTTEQWKSITEHLKTVFVKVTPPVEFRLDKGVRSLELRPEDRLREYMEKNQVFWPNGGAPAITC